ncbi:hypothetical protein AC251_09180 [Ralstonia pseudosolanacearum]|nr:hypothetical protein AC251_09180 [Ralstonia pseudosolanacearum]
MALAPLTESEPLGMIFVSNDIDGIVIRVLEFKSIGVQYASQCAIHDNTLAMLDTPSVAAKPARNYFDFFIRFVAVFSLGSQVVTGNIDHKIVQFILGQI